MITRITKSIREAVLSIEGTTFRSKNRTVEIFIADDMIEGYADLEKTEAAKDAVVAILGWGGYRSGCGSWVLSQDHVARSEWSLWVD